VHLAGSSQKEPLLCGRGYPGDINMDGYPDALVVAASTTDGTTAAQLWLNAPCQGGACHRCGVWGEGSDALCHPSATSCATPLADTAGARECQPRPWHPTKFAYSRTHHLFTWCSP